MTFAINKHLTSCVINETNIMPLSKRKPYSFKSHKCIAPLYMHIDTKVIRSYNVIHIEDIKLSIFLFHRTFCDNIYFLILYCFQSYNNFYWPCFVMVF